MVPHSDLLRLCVALCCLLPLSAGEADPPPVAGTSPATAGTTGEASVPPPPPIWTHELKLGAFLNQAASGGTEVSRDPAIAGTKSSVSYLLRLDGFLTWAIDPNELRQEAKVRYGRLREDGADWTENNDEIRYDATFFHFIKRPHFLYAAARAETVFTGPDRIVVLVDPTFIPVFQAALGPLFPLLETEKNIGPENFTPGKVSGAAGYGLRFVNLLLPTEDRLEFRVGVRTQRQWGHSLLPAVRHWETGFEATLDYRNKIREDMDWFIHAESFAPFNDLGHVTNWAEAGIDIKVNKYVSISISGRAYYESHPEDIGPVPHDGYDEMSWKQEALIGLAATF